MARHGWDRRGLAGSKDLGGSRSGLGGSELVRESQSSDPHPFEPFCPTPSPSGAKMGLGAFPSNQGSRARGQRRVGPLAWGYAD